MFRKKCETCGTKENVSAYIKFDKDGKQYTTYRCPRHKVLL